MKPRQRSLKALALLLGVSLLGACTFSTPFTSASDRAGSPLRTETQPLVVAVTHITLNHDTAARAKFWQALRTLDRVMLEQPGLVGYAKRFELFGDQAWTVSVWEDTPSLHAFMQSPVHRRAIAEADGSFLDARFARLAAARDRIPLPWDEILAVLERSGRHYWE